jgi:hypothetical protein
MVTDFATLVCQLIFVSEKINAVIIAISATLIDELMLLGSPAHPPKRKWKTKNAPKLLTQQSHSSLVFAKQF